MTMVLMVIMTYHQLLLKQTMETPSRAKNVQLNSIWIKSVKLQNPQWPKQQRCKVSNSLKVWSKPHAFIQSMTNLAYCFLNDRGLTICVASLDPQCSPILVNPWQWWTCIWLYELLFKGCCFKSLWTILLISILQTVAARFKLPFISSAIISVEQMPLLLLAPEAWKSISEFHPVQRHWSAHCMAATFTQCWDNDHSSASFVWLPLHLLVPQEHGRISTV
jgi:hypothetical protein